MSTTTAQDISIGTPVGRIAAIAERGRIGAGNVRTVADILASRADPTVHTIAPTATVYEATRLMTEKRISALIVCEGKAITGIVTERDFTQKVLLGSRSVREIPVRDIMTSPIISVSASQTVTDCMLLMGKHRLRHLPVLAGDELLGMISIRDFVNDIIASL